MDGLDGLTLRKALAVLQRRVPHRTSRVDWQWFESLLRSIDPGRSVCEGQKGAAQQGESTAGRLTRKAHP